MREEKTIKASGHTGKLARNNRWKIAAAGAFLLYGLLLNVLSRSVPGFSEWHVRSIFPFFSDGLARLTGLLPFSLFEMCIYLLAGSLIWHIARGLAAFVLWLLCRCRKQDQAKQGAGLQQKQVGWQEQEEWQEQDSPARCQELPAEWQAAENRPVKRQNKLSSRCMAHFCSLFCAISLLFAVASASCLVNYGRSTAAELLELSVQPSSAAELKELCALLAEDAAAVVDDISLDNEGCFTIGSCDVRQEARAAMRRLGERYEVLSGYYPQPKPVLWSEGMSYINLTGIYSAFTIEANYNAAVTDYVIPYTICHELSHLRGFIREDEAGFIAWLACFHSGSPVLRYSGALNALNYSLNAFYREVSYEEYAEFYNSMPLQIRWDLWNNSRYWRRHRTITYEMGRVVNDAYLKVNAQEGGVKSYGRMVDLLLAYRRAGAELI